ncbi:MAG: tetratricopeptide repeat protein, partial [Myxococcota bacterium]
GPSSPAVASHNAAVLADLAGDSPGPLALLAGLAGLLWLIRRRPGRWLAGALVCLAGGDIIYSLWVNPMGLGDLQNGLPLQLSACLAAGVGIAWFARTLGRIGPYAAAVLGLITAASPGLVTAAERAPAARSDRPRAFAEAGLSRVAPRGLALVQNASTAAGMIYLSAVEGARPDVAVLVRQHLADRERTRAMLARSGSAAEAAYAIIAQLPERPSALLALDRPIAWEIGRDALPDGSDLRAAAPLSQLVDASAQPELASAVVRTSRADISAAVRRLEQLFAGAGDRAALRVHGNALTALGRLAFARGDLDLADITFARAAQIRPGHVAAWVNRGVVAAHRRDWTAAIDHTERALALDPNRVGALINAARYHLRAGDDDRARALIDRTLSIAPDRADAWALAGLSDLRRGQHERALRRIHHALDLDPSDPDALDLLRQLDGQRMRPSPEGG